MPRLFQIIPVVSSIRRTDGRMQSDGRVSYAIEEDAERALDTILEPYGEHGGLYLDVMQVRSPGPWAYVALSRAYDIAKYVVEQRDRIGGAESFKFTIYDRRAMGENTFVPKVACLLFFSKSSFTAGAEEILFLRPAWHLLCQQPTSRHWLVLLDEDPDPVIKEALGT
jgi:hypothetical protein